MEIEQVPADQWQEWSKRTGGTLVDVREPHEWDLGTLGGSVLVSLGDLPDHLDEMRELQPLLMVCRSGARSQQAALFLTMSEIDRVANLAGGVKALGMQD